MDRIIEVKVGGNYLSKDNKNAGVKGEANVTHLRITFDEGWDEYAKTVTFWDAQGKNPVKRIQGIDLIEDITKDTRTYITPIPKEPLAIAGEMTFVIDGYLDGKRQRSLSDRLEVKDAPITDDAGEPTDPTPTQAEQLQMQIDKFKGDVQVAVIARDEAKVYRDEAEGFSQKATEDAASAENNAKTTAEKALEAEQSAILAAAAVGKTSYIGENGNWYAWDGSNGVFYDTEIKAQAGSKVYVGYNPPDDADVWIYPDGNVGGGGNAIATMRGFVNILGGADNWTAEDIKDNNGNVIGTRYGQIVNVNNAVITPYSKVDLQITSEQMVIFYEKDLAFVAENEEGVVTIYCIGNVPENDYTLQATVTEVTVNG